MSRLKSSTGSKKQVYALIQSEDGSEVLIAKRPEFKDKKRVSKQAGQYVLPGGGINKGKFPESAAARELEEECGVDILYTDFEVENFKQFYLVTFKVEDLKKVHDVIVTNIKDRKKYWELESVQIVPTKNIQSYLGKYQMISKEALKEIGNKKKKVGKSTVENEQSISWFGRIAQHVHDRFKNEKKKIKAFLEYSTEEEEKEEKKTKKFLKKKRKLKKSTSPAKKSKTALESMISWWNEDISPSSHIAPTLTPKLKTIERKSKKYSSWRRKRKT